MELAYEQDIRATTAMAGDSSVHQKRFVWNTALTQAYFDGRIRPVFEVLGTTIGDAADAADEGTVVELAGAAWIAPFSDDSLLSPVSIGLGWSWPVHGRLESELTGVLIVQWSWGT